MMNSFNNKSRRLILSFAVLAIANQGIDIGAASNTTGIPQPCGDELSCQNGGSCIEPQTFTQNGTATGPFQCECPPEWTGKNCELENIIVDNEQTTDGEGGKTNETINTGDSDEAEEQEQEDGNDDTNNEEEDTDDDSDGDDSDSDDHVNDDNVNCHLQCNNGGTCAKGVKDLGLLQDFIANVTHLNQTHDEELFEHCICPDGWTGLQCDYEINICGTRTDENGTSVPVHVCLHGSSCSNYGDVYGCDCSIANATFGEDDDTYSSEYTMFAGDSCQYPATDICVRPGSFATQNQKPRESNYFCTNHGRCYGYVSDLKTERFPGCDCLPGWGGDHCEVPTEIYIVEKKSTAEKAALLGTAVFVILGVIIAGFILLRSEDDSDRVYGVSKPKNSSNKTKKNNGNDRKRFWQVRSARRTKAQEEQKQTSNSATVIPPPAQMFNGSGASSSNKVLDLHSLTGTSSAVLDKIVEEGNAFVDPEAQQQQEQQSTDDGRGKKEVFQTTLFLKSDDPPDVGL